MLDEDDRLLRFGQIVPNHVIENYVRAIDFTRDTVFGVFDSQFGMGFAANVSADGGLDMDGGDAGDQVETLYLAGNPGGSVGTEPVILGSMNTTTLAVTTIGTVGACKTCPRNHFGPPTQSS